MPTISFDGRSLMIDGRRIWLVSGSIHYARVPRDLWAARIAAARAAGLNCICTDVFWNVHEPEPGEFYFEDEADVRHFVELIGAADMYCIFRPGPYIGGDWDFGGLPPWLTTLSGVCLRESNPASQKFLEFSSRFLGTLLDQVKDLQITSPAQHDQGGSLPGGGPIILMQAENKWRCRHEDQAIKYLREIVRYLRENGCTVPITIANNFWQEVEGAFDTWCAAEHLAGDLRQMRHIQPEAPRIVSECGFGQPACWGQETVPDSSLTWENRLAQVTSSGSQYNIHMFHGGTNFGFYGARSTKSADSFITTSYDSDAPLSESGRPREKFWGVKRLSTFASQFAHVFAHLDAQSCHAAVLPEEAATLTSVIHLKGTQGDVVFFFGGTADASDQFDLLLPEGLTLPVPLGGDHVSWLLLGVNLGVAELTYTNLRPWAFIDSRMLVFFGPSGAEGLIGINDAPLTVTVPTGRTPRIDKHEDLTIVVLNHEQVDAAQPDVDGLRIGSLDLGDEQPWPVPGWKSTTTIRTSGQKQSRRATTRKGTSAPRLTGWQRARVTEWIDGSSPHYEWIEGPASLDTLKTPYGYGWYRVNPDGSGAALSMAPQAGDRLHLFRDGHRELILGVGEDAQPDPVELSLDGPIVALADNLGRFSDGWLLGEQKGLWGHLYEVKPLRIGRPAVQASKPPDPFALGGFFEGIREGETAPASSLVWRVKSVGSQPLLVVIENLAHRAMLVVNGQPVGLYDAEHTAGIGRFLLTFPEHLRRRPNELRLSLFEPISPSDTPTGVMKVYQVTRNLTEKAEWAFAPWTMPLDEAFGPMAKDDGSLPCWFRGSFKLSRPRAPLTLDLSSMRKGQIYLNGHNLGRYFTQKSGRRAAPHLNRYYLPEPYLRTDQPNELALFDEHGQNPNSVRLVYESDEAAP